MSSLYLTKIQPNPPGRDAAGGIALPGKLNEEFVEFEVRGASRNMSGDLLTQLTFRTGSCTVSGTDAIFKFGSIEIPPGRSIRIHTGAGSAYWDGNVLHAYAGRSWFVWNNDCGDRAALEFNGLVLDWAAYAPSPREGILVRVPNTNRFI
jgi:hypothetical protein